MRRRPREVDLDELARQEELVADALAELTPLVLAAPADKDGFARAVRRIAYAEGLEDTRAAIRRAVAAGVAWELRLGGRDLQRPEDIAEVMADVG